MLVTTNMRPLAMIALFLTAIVLSGCQTTGTSGESTTTNQFRVAKSDYNIFFDQKDHLKELLTADNYADASILYEEQRPFFDTNAPGDPELQAALSKVVEKVSKTFESDISETLQDISTVTWPAPTSDWYSIRIKVQTSERILSIIPKDGVFVNPSYRPDGLTLLQNQTASWRTKFDNTIESDFLAFTDFNDKPFFQTHPSTIGSKAFFKKYPSALPKILAGRTAPEIKALAQSIDKNLVTEDTWELISNAYMDARLQEIPVKNRDIASILAALSDAKSAGFKVKSLNSTKIGFIEVTSRTLLDQGQIEFPAEVDVDLPFNISKEELDTALSSNTATDADYLIVFDVALAKTRRKVGRMKKVKSELIVGYKQEVNPRHTQLQNNLSMAQMAAQNASMNLAMRQNQYCSGLACIAVAIGINAAEEERDKAQSEVQSIMSRLNASSPMIEVPLKRPYSYEVASVKASKTMTVHYYVIDRQKKRYFKSTFDVVENKDFGVAYRIEDSDPNKKNHASKHDTEATVADWEAQPSTIKLSQLVGHYIDNQKDTRPLKNIEELRRVMIKDRNTAVAKYKENTFEESTASDPRFDSVVVIYMPDGGLGSGFFVRPDIVMTNYHVVEEGDFAELKMHDEQETFGKVIARDAGLDLALIKVQSRGKPARLYSKNKIELGSTVEVIGHPRGYEFSITRGVVSAVRRATTANLNPGPKVLQVQIDAASSPGNSGGPVFLGDNVISIISWGRVDRGSYGLTFSIHHSEAQQFLKDALGSGS